ncbi:AAA family ATPase [Belnapia sp. T18]|uniref:non-specific serine/threonine protein kinase n=1 Tax=Belnapia arida TaxID=2804533 RepID=A0ABS1UD79_9PROT|nr:ATPase domain-containing protein [Belnapia arida]MBL6081894.1 AAA family ATPase [Belnapia arida]
MADTSGATSPGGGAGHPQASTGIPGLDDILAGGLTRDRLYLVEGTPGTGKTTLALQFLLEGQRRGEQGMYITLSETADELRASAATHGWSLDDLSIVEMVPESGLDPEMEQTLLPPSEFELGETTGRILARVEQGKPARLVIDSLSELRLLAQTPLRYRRQVLALKHHFTGNRCTVLLLDDRTAEPRDLQLHSIAHGVVALEQRAAGYGPVRRHLQVVKMRGVRFRSGQHDFSIETGGLAVYPRLVAAEHHDSFAPAPVRSGVPGLDALLGGGLMPGTNTLIMGPTGVGKTSTATSCALAALDRGDPVSFFLFDEGMVTFLARSAALGMDLAPHLEAGRLRVRQIDPAELSPGECAHVIRHAVESEGARVIAIDSLNAYLHAMPDERHLLLQMHELLGYLNQRGVVTLLILGQHGLVGDLRGDVDLSYLSDALVLMRFFETAGEVRRGLSVVKTRTTAHERTIREFNLGPTGLAIGDVLREFDGVLTGAPVYRGMAEGLLQIRTARPEAAPESG